MDTSCPYCGARVPGNERVCPDCGERQPRAGGSIEEIAILTATDALEEWASAEAMRPADAQEAAYRDELRRKALRPLLVLVVLGALAAIWVVIAIVFLE